MFIPNTLGHSILGTSKLFPPKLRSRLPFILRAQRGGKIYRDTKRGCNCQDFLVHMKSAWKLLGKARVSKLVTEVIRHPDKWSRSCRQTLFRKPLDGTRSGNWSEL